MGCVEVRNSVLGQYMIGYWVANSVQKTHLVFLLVRFMSGFFMGSLMSVLCISVCQKYMLVMNI